ncbi:CinA family protein [Campylobacter sputorum]|uniref:CinA family protein n=1 Tax=Campylobacter sputorum TaxID=206 RepID=UPI00053BF8AB|nr:CinA family protein [Campylobacter sputorum]
MQHGILIIGEDIILNSSFLTYIYEKYEDYFGEKGVINYINKNDKNLPFNIEHYTFAYDILTIFTTDDNYHIASKVLATLTSDILELKDEMLVPSKVSKFSNGSFVLKINNAEVNLINANPTQDLPPFLSKFERNFAYFSIFDLDSESAKILLEPLAKTYDININLSQMVANWTIVKAVENKFGQIDGFLQSAKNLFSQKIILQKDPIKHIANTLIKKGLKITFAESCSCGLLAAKFGSYSGVSSAFGGSLVTYANEIKSSWLGVRDTTLQTYGAVSSQCVEEMIKGTLVASGADFAIAISGIAGPDGGSKEKPVGTVFIGSGSKDGNMIVERFFLKGNRNYIREQSATLGFLSLIRLRSDIFFEE